MLERSRIVEIVVAVSTVVVMIAVMAVIGHSYSENGYLSMEGAQLLVGAIVGFVLLSTAIGVGLAFALDDASPAES